MTDVVGHTPVVRLERVVPPDAADVYVKLEWFNPTGSYKDRMALAMIEEAERRGELRPGMTVVEYTGGSTGSSLAFVCASKGYALKLVSSDAFSIEKRRTMAALGADLTVIESDGGEITPELLPKMVAATRELAAASDVYWTDQFNNADQFVGYRAIGEELLEQLDGRLDVFCAAVGTAGMLVGATGALADAGCDARVVVFEPSASAVISTGVPGRHSVEGVALGIVPPLLDAGSYDEVRTVDESAGREMARRLAREEGLFAGISSGLNVAGAVQIASELGPGHNVVTVACDTGLKYLAGDLYG